MNIVWALHTFSSAAETLEKGGLYSMMNPVFPNPNKIPARISDAPRNILVFIGPHT
jgi:hypothetical protein